MKRRRVRRMRMMREKSDEGIEEELKDEME